MPSVGLEPTRRKAPVPKTGMSTNFITKATCCNYKDFAHPCQQLVNVCWVLPKQLDLYTTGKLLPGTLTYHSNTLSLPVRAKRHV